MQGFGIGVWIFVLCRFLCRDVSISFSAAEVSWWTHSCTLLTHARMNSFLEYRRKKSADLKWVRNLSVFQFSDCRIRANGSTTHQSKISKQASNEWKNIKMTRSVSKKLKRESTEVDGDDMLWPLSTASAPVPEKIYFNGEGWRTYCQIMGLSLGN